jgi:hypothetical protein
MEKLTVNMSVSIKNILRIDEVGKSITIQFQMIRNWFDGRLTFQNLKDLENLNSLSPQHQAMLWFPWIELVNIESEAAETDRPRLTQFKILKDPTKLFTLSDLTYLENLRLYKGSEHKLSLTKEFTVVWMCTFNMVWYPFDTQTCQMEFEILKKFSKTVQLVPDRLNLLFSSDGLSQYFIRDTRMCSRQEGDGVVVTISLTRLPYSNILTTYLPSTMLFVLSHLTNAWEGDFIDMVVEVNLTILLVLATRSGR